MARPLEAKDTVSIALPARWVVSQPASGVAARIRAGKIAFIAVFGFTLLTITRPVDSNGNLWARMALTYSVVDRGSLNIDPYLAMAGTPDWSYANGHYFSNKAPGPALMAVPFYAAQRVVQRALGIEAGTMSSYRVAAWVANLFLGILPTLAALLLFWKVFEVRYGFSALGAFGMTALAGAASLSLPYATFLFAHQTAAAFIALAIGVTLLEAERLTTPRPGILFAAGLFAGLAVLADHMAALGVIAWSVWILFTWRDRPVALGWWILGGLGPALALLWFNAAAFGSPFTSSYTPGVLNPAFIDDQKWHAPQLSKLLELTIGFYRGWFYATPVYACILLGMVYAWKQRRVWPELMYAAVVITTVLLVLSSWNSWHGGEAIGPRYLVWAMPLATLLLVPVAKRFPAWLAVLGQLTAVLMIAVTVTNPLVWMRWPHDPFVRTAWPILRGTRSTPTETIFGAFGASPAISFALYVLIWIVAAVWIHRQLTITAPRAAGAR